jgi:hypothetical protein
VTKILIIFTAILLFFSGCAKEEAGIGVVPLEGVSLQGEVVESDQSGVLLRTKGGRTALLPDDWEYRANGERVDPTDLLGGTAVRAFAPAEDGRLVATTGKNLVVANDRDTFILPVESFPAPSRQVPVRVRNYGGQTSTMPLQSAVYSPEYTVLSHPSYTDYSFPAADPYSVSRAYVVGQYQDAPLALVPGSGNLQVVSLPPAHYPAQSLPTNRPVRFTYANNDVAVTSWDGLGDGQINLSEILLAGTLLDVLPGQALIEVGSQPYMVPHNFVYTDGRPVVWNSVRPGAPVDVRYYPGLYDVIDYSPDYFTLSYDNSIVQLPPHLLPDLVYHQPVAVYQEKKVKRLPFGQAKKMLHAGSARLVAAPGSRKYWKNWKELGPKHHRKIPGYDNYLVYNHRGAARVQTRQHDKRPKPVFYGTRDMRARGPAFYSGNPHGAKPVPRTHKPRPQSEWRHTVSGNHNPKKQWTHHPRKAQPREQKPQRRPNYTAPKQRPSKPQRTGPSHRAHHQPKAAARRPGKRHHAAKSRAHARSRPTKGNRGGPKHHKKKK